MLRRVCRSRSSKATLGDPPLSMAWLGGDLLCACPAGGSWELARFLRLWSRTFKFCSGVLEDRGVLRDEKCSLLGA